MLPVSGSLCACCLPADIRQRWKGGGGGEGGCHVGVGVEVVYSLDQQAGKLMQMDYNRRGGNRGSLHEGRARAHCWRLPVH